MRWIKVSEFCKQEGVSHQGVYAKLNSYRYEQDLKNHVRGYKGKRELDETAVEILRPKKPTGTPKRADLDEIKERLAVVEERTENISAAMDEIRELAARISKIEQTFSMILLPQHDKTSNSTTDRQQEAI